MKNTGITRKVDRLGRIVLPMELRRVLTLSDGDPIELYVEDDKIVLRKYQPECHCCGSTNEKGLISVDGITLCPGCIQRFTESEPKILTEQLGGSI